VRAVDRCGDRRRHRLKYPKGRLKSDDQPLGPEKTMADPSSLKMDTSSIPGIVLTPNRLRVLTSFLSSEEAVLVTALAFLRTVPLPPMRACTLHAVELAAPSEHVEFLAT
jgi:hypothetical protein